MAQALILLTNDDGFNSPGLLAAAAAIADLGELLIAAPRVQQSGMGRSWPIDSSGIITRHQVRVNGQDRDTYAVDGSPVQAVVHAMVRLAPRRPNLVISGINYGQNLGPAVTSSGTVGAAMEAAISGIPGLAVSLEVDKALYHSNSDQVDFNVAAHFVRLFAERMLTRPLPPDVDLLKVDVPAGATVETDWVITRQSRKRYFVGLPVEGALLGEPLRLGYDLDPNSGAPGTDTYALAKDRKVSVTPLSIDLTSRTDLEALRTILLGDGHPTAT
jgi:5'-nucleotidase